MTTKTKHVTVILLTNTIKTIEKQLDKIMTGKQLAEEFYFGILTVIQPLLTALYYVG